MTGTTIKINNQNKKIEQLNIDKNNLHNAINSKDKTIGELDGKIKRMLEVEQVLNNKIVDITNFNNTLQKEKEELQHKTDEAVKKATEMEESITYNQTRNEFLEQRNAELKEEVKKKIIAKTENPLKIAVDIGHNAKPDSGAVSKYGSEDTFTKAVGTRLIELLKAHGHEVVQVEPHKPSSVNNSLRQRVTQANEGKVDLFISIHFNSSSNPQAEGTEVFINDICNPKLKQQAENIAKNFEKYGYKNRGVKTANFFVLKNSDAPSMLIECSFITNLKDMARYEADNIAENIFNGLF